MSQGEVSQEAGSSQAGRWCLDLANTVEWHASDHPEERLHGYADLAAWAATVGIVAPEEAERLTREAAQRPAEAAAVLRAAIALREAIYRLFSATARGEAPAAGDLEVLNAALGEALGRARVVAAGGCFSWGWAGAEGALEQLLWPVARSAAELLTSEDRQRVGECADDRGCGWLFLDASRNHSRRWCDMRDCGNRAKARRHYARARGASQSRGKAV